MIPRSSLLAAAAVTAAALASSPARAQVNSEPLRKKIHDKGFSGLLSLTFDGRTGNTTGVTTDGLVGAGFASERNLVFAFASVDYSRANGTLAVDKSFAHARYNYEIDSWFWWEVFAQAQSDVFEKIKLRDLWGTGPRFALYKDDEFGLYLGVAYMFERDVYDVPSSDGRVQFMNRISIYLTAHAALADGIDAVTTTYVQPRIDDPGDIRVQSESGFVFKIKAWLATSISFVAHYDSSPPSGVLPTDTELKNALTLTM